MHRTRHLLHLPHACARQNTSCRSLVSQFLFLRTPVRMPVAPPLPATIALSPSHTFQRASGCRAIPALVSAAFPESAAAPAPAQFHSNPTPAFATHIPLVFRS